MRDYQRAFLDYVVAHGILRFGEFRLKSGRRSPYFFNAGLFNTGAALDFLGRSYAAAIDDVAPPFDLLFGPAYKGIPLVAATAMALARDFGVDKPWCFNRKEAKDHGEGGKLVGAPLDKRVLIVDDVITAGTAIGEVMALLAESPASACGVMVALDRQERGQGEGSAIQDIERRYKLPVSAIIRLEHIVRYLEAIEDPALRRHLPAMKSYQQRYGVDPAQSAP